MIFAYVFIAAAVILAVSVLAIAWWDALCRRNDLFDMQVIARGRDCKLDEPDPYDGWTAPDSAGDPTNPHLSPAAVQAVVRTSEAVGTSTKPAAAGSSLDLHAPGARQKIAAQLTKAAQFVSSGDEDHAHDMALLAVHELNCRLRERMLDRIEQGVVR